MSAKTVYPDKTFNSHEEWRKEVLRQGVATEALVTSIQALAAHFRSVNKEGYAAMLETSIASYREQTKPKP